MNIPQGERGQKMLEGIKLLKSNNAFSMFLDWIDSERNARDVENRTKGCENTTSEAEALTTILEIAGHESNKNKIANVIVGDGTDANEESGWV